MHKVNSNISQTSTTHNKKVQTRAKEAPTICPTNIKNALMHQHERKQHNTE